MVSIAVLAWGISFAIERTDPSTFDFIALYASARLVATGHGSEVTSRDAIIAAEHQTHPDLPSWLSNPNLPAVALLLSPLGALPFDLAYAVFLTVATAALAASALLLQDLAPPPLRRWLFGFALLSPPALISLVQGQLSPFALLAIAGARRAPPAWSGLILAGLALRPQFLPLFAVVALADRERRPTFVIGVAAVAGVSLAVVGFDGLGPYVSLLHEVAGLTAPHSPGLLGLPSLGVILGLRIGDVAMTDLALGILAALVGMGIVLRTPQQQRLQIASGWALLAAPHALPHDLVLAYPLVAWRAVTLRAASLWAASGALLTVAQIFGVPISLWLLAVTHLPRGQTRGHGETKVSLPI